LIAQRYITTHISKTVHGAGADFADLVAAFSWLRNYIITQTGYVTFLVASGRWTYTQTVEIDHPNASRVAIQGAALLGASPQGSNMSVTGYHNAADGTNQIIYLRSIYATELSFTGGVTGFLISRGGLTLRYLLITGSQTTAVPPSDYINPQQGYGSGLEVYERVEVDGCSVWGFGNSGFYVTGGGTVNIPTSLNVAISYCYIAGVYNVNGTVWANCGEFIITSNGSWAIHQSAGFTTCWYPNHAYIRGNGGAGIGTGAGYGAVEIADGGAVSIGGQSTVMQNGGAGVHMQGTAAFYGTRGTYAYNAGGGVIVSGTSTAYINLSSIYGNSGNALQANGTAYIEMTGSSISGPIAQDGFTVIG